MGTPSLDKVPNLHKFEREHARFHQETVSDLLHRHDTKFPGAQPVSFARRHLKELERADYFLAEKTDGIRLLLYLTRTQNQQGQWVESQFLIDRKNDYYYIEPGYLHLPCATPDGRPGPDGRTYDVQSYHVNTLLDGELVLQNFGGRKQLTYIIFDILVLQGTNVAGREYSQRIDKILRSVMNPYKAFAREFPEDNRAQPFQIEAKKPSTAYAAPQMFKEVLPNLPHGNDGLIFTCKDTPYVSGTDQHILKWKPPHENTIDFKLQIGAFPMARDEDGEFEDFDQIPDIELLVYHGNKDYRTFAKLHLTEEEWEVMKGMNQKFDHRIIECWREKETGNWRPKIDGDGTPRFRDDKEHANHNTVVDSVLQSIEDAVTEDDLIAAFNPIRTAWKAREARAKEAERAMRQSQHQQQQQHARDASVGRSMQPPDISHRTSSPAEDDGPTYVD